MKTRDVMRRRLVRAALAGAVGIGAVVPGAAVAQQAPAPAAKPTVVTPTDPKANQVRGDEITPAQEASVAKGLAWLARAQGRDGSYGHGAGSPPA